MVVNLQEWIHRVEEGPYFRYLRAGLIVLIVVALLFGYNARCYRNFATPDAMDSAQLARNIAEGKGYTTQFVRPLSIYLIKSRSEKQFGLVPSSPDSDYAKLKTAHPDLANPPVYPLVLAALMKVLPFRYSIDVTGSFWGPGGRFQPDFLIALFNQLLFFGVLCLVYLLTRKLFDTGVARLTSTLLLCSELMWRFTVSGLSTMLLLLVFMGIVWCLVLLDEEMSEPRRGSSWAVGLAGAIGALCGLGVLTRYSFGWVIVPVTAWLAVFVPRRRAVICSVVVGVFLVMLTPWVLRNLQLCGVPFGTATYSPLEATFIFPGYKLERSLQPNFSIVFLKPFIHKLLIGLRQIIQNDLIRLGGSWATSFYLVGLLLGFRNPRIRRLRYFLTATLGVFMVVQSLGRTQLSDDSPEVSSENLLVLTFPLVLIMGVAMFYVLLGQMNLFAPALRIAVMSGFALVMSLPMITAFLPPRVQPLVFPPYKPYVIQRTAGFMKENDMLMSDMPWAMAWYGNRQCLWLTLNAEDEFFAVNDLLKPVRGLYLTQLTTDSRFLSDWLRAGEHSWGNFVFEFIVRHGAPEEFPLRSAPQGYTPEQLFLTDWNRWRVMESPPAKPGNPGNSGAGPKR